MTIDYDIILVTAGAVTRTFPVPGLREHAIGFKHVEEAVAVRDRVLTALDRAAVLPAGRQRTRLLTFTVVGGGFTGIEVLGELLSLASAMIKRYPELGPDDLTFHLVEAKERVLPEVGTEPARWVVRSLRDRGARVHLRTSLISAENGHLVLSDGEEFDSDLIIWTAGNAATEVISRHTDLPTDRSGLLIVRPDLRVGSDDLPIVDAWAAGDDALIPDLASDVPGARTVPNAQHAVRQGKRVGRNIAAQLHGGKLRPYVHHSIGVVATLGIGRGIFQYHRLVITGPPAWLIHRGYHVLAVPMWERKVRVAAGWVTQAVFGRDLVSLEPVQHPRQAFVDAAADDDHVRPAA
jgi:NADH dehydrogenase